MLVNIIVLSLIALFILYCIIEAARHFIGYNPNPKPWRERWREWVKRNIVDDYPYEESSTIDEVNARRGK